MTYNATQSWNQHWTSSGIAYPAEYLIRIMKGSYPNLSMPRPAAGQRILDVGCGDGCNLLLFKAQGLEAHGVEITQPIVDHLKTSLGPLGIEPDHLRVGSCARIPYEDESFDFVVTWNSSYYMSLDQVPYTVHVKEFARVLKPGGWVIVSVPKPSSFIFKGSDPAETPGDRIIRNDPFGLRNGEVLHQFDSPTDLEQTFVPCFEQFCHASIHDDCFGYDYHWFLLVAQRK